MTRHLTALTTLALMSFVCYCFAQKPTSSPPQEKAPGSKLTGLQTIKPQSPKSVGHPGFLSPHASPIVILHGHVFVTNTQADTIDIIDASTRRLVSRINVGIQPVGLAIRPDGKELWVANHVSDSVSVIDTDSSSPTKFQVIATVQEFDPVSKATRFDEPVGIAFAGNDKAYVSLSSENTIAVIDVSSRKIVKRLDITAQDPRAIAVRGDRLYVLPFESNNKTQLSGGSKIDGDLVTFNAWEHSIRVNNVLSIGHVVDIIKHPKVPDRDLYVFDTKTDKLVKTVDTLGTLLYGITVDSKGRIYIAQTDARNDVNGRAGSKKHGLAELENRAFLNRITNVNVQDDAPEAPRFIDLEPLPPQNTEPGKALATPYAIAVSTDDKTLVATAAGSNKIFTVDVATGAVLGRTDVGAEPEGIAIVSSEIGKPARAWVLNAASDTVSVVDLTDPKNPKVETTITLEDPTHPTFKRGRIAFHNANASTNGTYSCASCHPDGHTDQLLWVLNTPIVTGGNQIMPRSTMPVRGLRDTAPFHWDGVPGDPYGGINSASVHKAVAPNSSTEKPESTTRHLVDGGLASTMAKVGDKTVNDEGKPGKLSAAERDDMAEFLLGVPFPPAQRRAYTNVLSSEASKGFKLFHVDGDNDPTKSKPNVCGDCHRMPYWVSTNTPGTGMDAPTWRGAYDRWLILPQGRLNIIEFDFYRRVAEQGNTERSIWQFSWGGRPRFNPVWDMVLEGSTGFSGAFARQVTLSRDTADQSLTTDLLTALERSAREGAIVLEGEGVFIEGGKSTDVAVQFEDDHYVNRKAKNEKYTRADLMKLAKSGSFLGTFTARMGTQSNADHPQPALWTFGPIEKQRGRQQFPVLFGKNATMKLSGRHIELGAAIFIDGVKATGSIACDGETVTITLAALPAVGMHFLQVQNRDGLLSNDFIFHVSDSESSASDGEGKTLGAILRKSSWNRLIGTWVDAESNGAGLKTTYAWKVQDRVIEVRNKESTRESIALITLNSKTGEVSQSGGGSDGDTFAGKWLLKDGEDAVLDVGFTSGEGEQGSLKIRYHFESDDTLLMTLELPQPIKIKMIRSRTQ